MWKRLFTLIALVALAVAACPAARAAGEGVSTNAAAVGTNTNEIQPEPYTRVFNPDTNTVQLQIAVRKFVPVGHRGPVIWLAGASHIGDQEYYRALQKHLDAQTVVLFEGVNADAHPRRAGEHGARPPKPKPATPATSDGTGTNEGFSMQSALAKSLDLVFQLEAIDYDRTNFFNSDLSVFDIQRLMIGDSNAVPAEPGEQGRSSASFDSLLQIMDGSSFLGAVFKMGIQFIGSNPQMQSATRLMLAETLGGLKGDISQVRGLPPDMKELLQVLIAARNAHVVEDLKGELKRVPDTGSVAVFYGTGHMDDMEKRVTKQLGYRPAGDVWFTAFSVDLRKTGLSPGELKMMRNLVKWQLDQMQR